MAKVAAFDDPVRFEHNVMAVKVLQASGDPLSRVETQHFKDFWTCLNPESNPYCYEILLDVQAAQFMVQEAQAIEDFKTRRDEGHLLGGQIDAWTRWGRKFMCFNYTYLKLGVVETDEGPKRNGNHFFRGNLILKRKRKSGLWGTCLFYNCPYVVRLHDALGFILFYFFCALLSHCTFFVL